MKQLKEKIKNLLQGIRVELETRKDESEIIKEKGLVVFWNRSELKFD